jgi:3-oxoacyl-[acyl-carrier protein] reductase
MALTGKKALITGGSRGIGAAIARRFAGEGADVAITYTSRPEAAEAVVAEVEAAGRKGLPRRSRTRSPGRSRVSAGSTS